MPDWKSIFAAAPSDQRVRIETFLDEGGDVNELDSTTGWTPLMKAVSSPGTSVEAVELLLDRGADPNACATKAPINAPLVSMESLLAETGIELPPQIQEMMKMAQGMLDDPRTSKAQEDAAVELAVKHASAEIVGLLIDRGADVHYSSPNSMSLLTTAAYRRCDEIISLLIDAGAPLDEESDYGESALSVLAYRGNFTMVRKLLEAGADLAPLQWLPLHRAVALGTLDEMAAMLDRHGGLESPDRWGRTPFLIAVHAGDVAKAALLLARGANRDAMGRGEKPALHYPADRDDVAMLDWLLDQGFDRNGQNSFHHTALRAAVEAGAAACVRRLLEAGADWRQCDDFGQSLVHEATHPEVIRTLVEWGADIRDLEPGPLRDWIGLGTHDELPLGEVDFLANRTRRFGTANPEVMNVPFWRAMVRNGWSGYQASSHFDKVLSGKSPVWSHQRFGMSLTALPDGRFVQIAGEHEDHYDPDFCIYNDVILHDGRGGFEIYGYPEEVFPPTDFHSATLVGPWIYIIGNLGYLHQRENGTPVYRLHTGSWKMEPVETTGPAPGWIHSHTATLDDGIIHVRGGKIFTTNGEGEADLVENTRAWAFYPETAAWEILQTPSAPISG